MNDRTSALLEAVQESLREQLEAAERTFERLDRALSRRDSTQIADLNRAVRRLRASASGHPASGGKWEDILVASTQTFSDRAALFAVRGASLRLMGARGIDAAGMSDVPLKEATAFRACIDTKDSVVAMRTAGEMSPAIASRLGEGVGQRSYLFPIKSHEQVIAVLYADADGIVQSDALELLATVAGIVVGSSNRSSASGLVNIAPAADSSDAPPIATSARADEGLHLKAQRFARVQAAKIRLYQSETVKNGRSGHDLYTSLKAEIDSAREVFERDFIAQSPGMVDYLHSELVRTLANDDVALLGSDYPGPLV